LCVMLQFGPGSANIVADHELFWTEFSTGDPSSEEEDSVDESDGDGYGSSKLPSGASHPPQAPAGRPEPRLPKVPKLQAMRNNLTALSQVYNLFFAAYRNRIAVYCPKDAHSQTLSRRPQLVLRPLRHPHASEGYLLPRYGHEVNNMRVGFLGCTELIAVSYDDGDVIAYQTESIAEAILQRRTHRKSGSGSSDVPSLPRPLLHENVGFSAWGLAIHSKSRLIAVSSNHHEVTVFALALAEKPLFRPRWKPNSKEANVLARNRMWRIVLPLGNNGQNIPSIDFVSDPEGFAVQVCAVDIHSNLVR
jgi:hypothetical protein